MRTMRSGGPGDGIGSGLPWSRYHAGSIHTSASHGSPRVLDGFADAGECGAAATASVGVASVRVGDGTGEPTPASSGSASRVVVASASGSGDGE